MLTLLYKKNYKKHDKKLKKQNSGFVCAYDRILNKNVCTQEVLAERLGALSSLTRSGVQPLSSSAAGLLRSPCHPGRRLAWAKPGIPWFTKKKKKECLCIFNKKIKIKKWFFIYFKNIKNRFVFSCICGFAIIITGFTNKIITGKVFYLTW
jgi:hypothetical protein